MSEFEHENGLVRQDGRMLLMDTCGMVATVALAVAAAIVARRSLPGRECSSQLLTVVREMLEATGWRVDELAAIVVASGPGSFTGIRIGLSFAKGLASATGVPIIAVSRLETLAVAACASGLVEAEPAGCLRVVLDAGRGELYLRRERGGADAEEILVTAGELVAEVDGGAVFACETGVEAQFVGVKVIRMAEPDAAGTVELAWLRLREGRFDDAALVDGNYVRVSDPQIFAKPVVKLSVKQGA